MKIRAPGRCLLSLVISETPPENLSVTAASGDLARIPGINIVLGGSGAIRTVTVIPAANQNGGPVTITLTVSDGALEHQTTFTVTVTPVNDAPAITGIANQTINEDGSTGPLAFVISDVETPPEELRVSAASSDITLIPDENIVLGGSGSNRTVTVTPRADRNGGPVTIVLVVEDITLSDNTIFEVTVLPVNDPPTITGIANQTILEDTSTGTLSFTIGDIDTPLASLTVTAASSNPGLVPPANIVLGGSGANRTVIVSPATNQNGTATITLTVSDGSLSSISTVLVTVREVNDPPVATRMCSLHSGRFRAVRDT